MGIYYEDDCVTLYHGDSLEILPTLDIKADVLLTDPPYFKVKHEEWDNQWDKASEFLGWMGEWLDSSKPLLAKNASVWVFASPSMTTAVERVIGERFRVLNSIRWVKDYGWHNKTSVSSLRSYLSPWEGIIFAETDSPLAGYLASERVRAGKSRKDIAELFPSASGRLTGCVDNWECGIGQPSRESYLRIREALGEGYLTAAYDDLRRPFSLAHREQSTDIWNFPTVTPFKGKHPCEKPQPMLRHMIEASSQPEGLVLDPFSGSGSSLMAAAALKRRAVGIEKDERWCEHAANRLSQGTLELEWTA